MGMNGKRILTRAARLKQRVLAVGVVFLHVLSVNASAQVESNVVKPESNWMTVGIGLGVVLLVCAPAFLNAKRSHMT